MKKRGISLLMVLVMLLGLLPTAAFAAEPEARTAGSGPVVSIENYETGELVLEPIRVPSNAVKLNFIRAAFEAAGIADPRLEEKQFDWCLDAIMDIQGVRSDEYNGSNDTGDKAWLLFTNNAYDLWGYTNWKNTPDNTVIRIVYTTNHGADCGFEGATSSRSDSLSVNKDELVALIADTDKSEARDAALAVLIDPKATESDVKTAADNLENSAQTVPATSVTLQPAGSETVKVGGKLTVTATVEPAETTDPLTWEITSGGDFVTLVADDKTATITGRAVGEAEITAKAGNQSATLKIAVSAIPAETVTISPPDQTNLEVHDEVRLSASIKPADSTDSLVWTVEGNAVSVSDTGMVTAKNIGDATVTATAGEASASVEFHVTDKKITGISGLDLRVGDTKQIPILPNNATETVTSWAIEENGVASIDQRGIVTALKPGTATVTATVGDHMFTAQIHVRKQASVAFQKKDGTIVESVEGVFTLNSLTEGRFILRDAELSVDGWECKEEVRDDNGSSSTHYWINAEGKFQPLTAKTVNAQVHTTDDRTLNFQIRNEQSGITELKTFVDGQEVSASKPLIVDGTGANGKTVVTKGLRNGKWVEVPNQALATDSTNSAVRINDGKIMMGHGTSATLTVFLKENRDIKVSFSVGSEFVPVESIAVNIYSIDKHSGVEKVPITKENPFIIDAWNSLAPYYVGISPNGNVTSGYEVTFTPANASNKSVKWEPLTPEIGTHMDAFDNGIIPNKAGVARYKVTSIDNPAASTEVQVHFAYKDPLKRVTPDRKKIETAVGSHTRLDLTYTPDNATEHRIQWTSDKEGVARIKEELVNNRNVTYTLIAEQPGTVTFTGKPYDNTAPDITLEVTVTGGGEVISPNKEQALADALSDIQHGLAYLQDQIYSEYNTEWTGFTLARSGATLDAAQQQAWKSAVRSKLNSGVPLKPTDYARLALALGAMGYDASNWEGYDLIEKLYNSTALAGDTSNAYCFALIALDSRAYKIPENAVWTRDRIIEQLGAFQCPDGSFNLSMGQPTGGVDMTAMVMQSLAPYRDTNTQAGTMFKRGLDYLKEKLTENCGYVNEGGENSCTTAQVLIALTAAGLDPLDRENGFTVGKNSLVSNLHTFRREEGGFRLLPEQEAATLKAGEQVTHALESYRRFVNGENRLFDFSDIPVIEKSARETLQEVLDSARSYEAKKKQYTEKSWKAVAAAMAEAEAAMKDQSLSDTAIREKTDALAAAIDQLKRVSSGNETLPTVEVSFRLIGADQSPEDVDIGAGKGVSRYRNWVKTRRYDMPEGSTVYDLFVQAMDDAGLKYEGAKTNYVSAIWAPAVLGGYKLSEFTNGSRSGWMFMTNGRHGGLGLKEQVLKDGDEIIWHYVNDFAYEIKDWAGSESQGGKDTWVDFAKLPDVDPGEELRSSAVVGETDRNGIARATLDGAAAEEFLYSLRNSGDRENTVATVAVEMELKARGIALTIPANILKELGDTENTSLCVTSGTGTVTLDPAALATAVKAAGRDKLVLTVCAAGTENLTEAVRTRLGEYPVYEICLMAGEKPISKLNGKAEVILPYQAAGDENTGDLTVLYINDQGQTEEMSGAHYDRGFSGMAFETDHFSLFAVAKKAGLPFTDVRSDDWFHDAVSYVYERGIMKGVAETSFAPGRTAARGMIVTMLWRMAGEPETTNAVPFTDIPADAYYAKAVVWAAENGIVTGIGDGTFAPDAPASRQQMAAILYRYASFMKCSTAGAADLSGFSDADIIAEYAKPALAWADANGLINGMKDNVLAPQESATRAQVAVILMRFCEKYAK